jgi:hypothetical protein
VTGVQTCALPISAATDVDVSLRSMGRGKGSPMTARQLAEIAGRHAAK